MKRNRKAKEAYAKEWEVIMSKYPRFARAHLAQQAILMEAALGGDQLVVRRMSSLLERGMVPIFDGFWLKKSNESLTYTAVYGTGIELIDCIAKALDPAECFPPLTDWFDDPFAEGKVILPPEGPPREPEPPPPPIS